MSSPPVNKQTNKEKGGAAAGVVCVRPCNAFDAPISIAGAAGAAGDPCVVIEKAAQAEGNFLGSPVPSSPAQTQPKRAKPGIFGCAARATLVTCVHHPAAQRVFRQGCGGSKPAALLKTTSVSGAPLILATRPHQSSYNLHTTELCVPIPASSRLPCAISASLFCREASPSHESQS